MQGRLGRLRWGWGTTPAGHRWIRVEWGKTPTRQYPLPRVRFWEMQWR